MARPRANTAVGVEEEGERIDLKKIQKFKILIDSQT